MRFFKKIKDWILKSKRIRERILPFFTRQINPRSLGSWCVKGTEESTLEVDSPVPLPHLDPKDLGFICVVKKRKIHYRFLSDLRILSWIFLKKRTVRLKFYLSIYLCFIKPIMPSSVTFKTRFFFDSHRVFSVVTKRWTL